MISLFPNLESLILFGNDLTELHFQCAPLTKLKAIQLSQNQFAAIPAELSMSLRAGSTVWVSLQLPGETVYREASVKSLSQVAEGGTSQRRVRISLPNPDGLPAGILARVRLDKPRDDAMTQAE